MSDGFLDWQISQNPPRKNWQNSGRRIGKIAENRPPRSRQNSGLFDGSKQAAALAALRLIHGERKESCGADGAETPVYVYLNQSHDRFKKLNVTPDLYDNAISFLESTKPLRTKDLNDELRIAIAGISFHAKNACTVFTWNFSAHLLNKAIPKIGAAKSGYGFTKVITEALRTALDEEFGQNRPQVVLVIERNPKSGLLHSHGIIKIDPDDGEAVAKVERAMIRANGGVRHSKQRAIEIKPPEENLYWATNYMTKGLEETRQFIQDSPVYFDRATQIEIKEFWQDFTKPQATAKPELIDPAELLAKMTRRKQEIHELVEQERRENEKPIPDMNKSQKTPISRAEKFRQMFKSRRRQKEQERQEWEELFGPLRHMLSS
jgi:hypothetical protein